MLGNMDGVQYGHAMGHHVHGAPLLALLSMVTRPQRIYIFLYFTIPKMKISTINYFIFLFFISQVLIDT